MSNAIVGASGAHAAAQVQATESTAKAKQSSSKTSSAPEDTVTISSQARAAQQASQPKKGGSE